jgi:hypothetical protein
MQSYLLFRRKVEEQARRKKWKSSRPDWIDSTYSYRSNDVRVGRRLIWRNRDKSRSQSYKRKENI